jgi:NAD(P)-dependent dehydrogenase (short-subunit alcohol dehydrogenase family)
MRELRGRVAVVTGAAGGIGQATARALANAGMDLVLADVDEPGMEALAAELRAQGRRVLCARTDVTDPRALEALLARTLAELGACHLIVNNAGVFHGASMLEAPESEWRRVIDINVWGVIHGSRIFGAHFVAQREGHIVNTASAAGLFPIPGMSSYSTSKYAVVGFSQQLRWELAAWGVGVTVLCPGIVRTQMTKARGVNLEHVAELDEIVSKAPPPEGLARKLVRAVVRNRPIVRYAPDAYLFSFLRLLPWWLLDPFGRFMARRAYEVVGPEARKLPPG